MAKSEAKRPSATAPTPEGKSFEEVLRRLEEIVESLEQGDIPVERSLALFEEGVGLAREGHRRLEAAEKRITELLEDGSERPLALDGEPARPAVTDPGVRDDDDERKDD